MREAAVETVRTDELRREALRASRRALKQAVAGALEATGGRRLLASW